MTKEAFLALNKRQAEAGEQMFANPRNSAAGSLRQKDPSITASRPLHFFAYTWGEIEDKAAPTQSGMIEWLDKIGFEINPLWKIVRSVDEMLAFHRDIERKARQARLRHRRRRLQARPPRLAGAPRLRLAQPALGDRAQVRGRAGDHGAARHRDPGRAHRRAHAGGEARAGDGRRRGGAERLAAQRGLHQGHRQRRRADPRRHRHPHRRHRDRAARRRRDPADRRRRARQAAEGRQAVSIPDQVPGLRQPCGARGRGGGAPLHRRADLPGAAGRAAAPFRVAHGLRHRGARRKAGAGVLRRRSDHGARRHLHAAGARRACGEEARRPRRLWRSLGAQPVRRHRRAAQDFAQPPDLWRSASATSARPMRGCWRGTSARSRRCATPLKGAADGQRNRGLCRI